MIDIVMVIFAIIGFIMACGGGFSIYFWILASIKYPDPEEEAERFAFFFVGIILISAGGILVSLTI